MVNARDDLNLSEWRRAGEHRFMSRQDCLGTTEFTARGAAERMKILIEYLTEDAAQFYVRTKSILQLICLVYDSEDAKVTQEMLESLADFLSSAPLWVTNDFFCKMRKLSVPVYIFVKLCRLLHQKGVRLERAHLAYTVYGIIQRRTESAHKPHMLGMGQNRVTNLGVHTKGPLQKMSHLTMHGGIDECITTMAIGDEHSLFSDGQRVWATGRLKYTGCDATNNSIATTPVFIHRIPQTHKLLKLFVGPTCSLIQMRKENVTEGQGEIVAFGKVRQSSIDTWVKAAAIDDGSSVSELMARHRHECDFSSNEEPFSYTLKVQNIQVRLSSSKDCIVYDANGSSLRNISYVIGGIFHEGLEIAGMSISTSGEAFVLIPRHRDTSNPQEKEVSSLYKGRFEWLEAASDYTEKWKEVKTTKVVTRNQSRQRVHLALVLKEVEGGELVHAISASPDGQNIVAVMTHPTLREISPASAIQHVPAYLANVREFATRDLSRFLADKDDEDAVEVDAELFIPKCIEKLHLGERIDQNKPLAVSIAERLEHEEIMLNLEPIAATLTMQGLVRVEDVVKCYSLSEMFAKDLYKAVKAATIGKFPIFVTLSQHHPNDCFVAIKKRKKCIPFTASSALSLICDDEVVKVNRDVWSVYSQYVDISLKYHKSLNIYHPSRIVKVVDEAFENPNILLQQNVDTLLSIAKMCDELLMAEMGEDTVSALFTTAPCTRMNELIRRLLTDAPSTRDTIISYLSSCPEGVLIWSLPDLPEEWLPRVCRGAEKYIAAPVEFSNEMPTLYNAPAMNHHRTLRADDQYLWNYTVESQLRVMTVGYKAPDEETASMFNTLLLKLSELEQRKPPNTINEWSKELVMPEKKAKTPAKIVPKRNRNKSFRASITEGSEPDIAEEVHSLSLTDTPQKSVATNGIARKRLESSECDAPSTSQVSSPQVKDVPTVPVCHNRKPGSSAAWDIPSTSSAAFSAPSTSFPPLGAAGNGLTTPNEMRSTTRRSKGVSLSESTQPQRRERPRWDSISQVPASPEVVPSLTQIMQEQKRIEEAGKEPECGPSLDKLQKEEEAIESLQQYYEMTGDRIQFFRVERVNYKGTNPSWTFLATH